MKLFLSTLMELAFLTLLVLSVLAFIAPSMLWWMWKEYRHAGIRSRYAAYGR